MIMNTLAKYYVRQAGGGSGDNGVGPIYTVTPFVQRGSGIGNFLSGLFRAVRTNCGQVKSIGERSITY